MKLNFIHTLRGGFLLLFVLLAGGLMAQTSISGTILDEESNDPLIGASVVVTGTSTGTVTDFDGNFSLNVPANAESLTISYTGYATQTVALQPGQTDYNINLASGELLDEVVVIGYGSVNKSDLTGAVTALSTEDFNQGIIVSPEELIQGRAAGVQVTQTSGEPGAGVNFRIRGTSSVNANNNPLFVIDGVPLSSQNTSAGGNLAGLGATTARNPLNFLNPNDIASVDILKDASATAIYGSRGANGVVLITTKSGTDQGNTISYDANVGFATISNRYDVLDRQEFLDAYESFNDAAAVAALDGGADTDWQDEVFRTGLTHSHSLAFGGANEDGNYRLSLSYFDQEGIIEESALRRITARFNANKNFFSDRLTIGTQLTVADIHDDNVPVTTNSGFTGDLLANTINSNPTNPVRDANGELFQVSQTEPNPVALLEFYEGFTDNLRFLGNITAELRLTDNLSLNTIVGLDRTFSTRVDAQSPLLNTGEVFGIGRASKSDQQTQSDLWENYLNYDQDIGGGIRFNGILGYSYQRFETSGQFLNLANFREDDLDVIINNFAAADQSQASSVLAQSFRNQDELQSFFTRLNFDFFDRFVLTGTVRADGSTRFGDGNRYGIFPSFAAKWRISEEAFAPESFSTLALRAGYGITGNQEIGFAQYLRRQRYGSFSTNPDASAVGGGGLGTLGLGDENLQWESTQQFNIGLDFGILNNRLNGTIDYYYKSTNDLLITQFIPPPSPIDFQTLNLEDADIINEGVELALNYIAIDRDNFSWNIDFNITYNDNRVENLDDFLDTGQINGQGLTGAFAQRITGGQPLFAYFLRDFGGFDESGGSIYNDGDFQQFTGQSPLPNITTGLTNRFQFGDVDLNIFFTGQFGHYIYNNTANAFFTAGSLANGRNVVRDVVGNGEDPFNAPDVSTRFLEKGDFLRLQNVTLGYNVPGSLGILEGLRVFVTGQNLFVITDYSGQDPEVSINKPLPGVGVPSAGIDYTPYPRATTITFGVNATFR